jgi:hypothetical protein
MAIATQRLAQDAEKAAGTQRVIDWYANWINRLRFANEFDGQDASRSRLSVSGKFIEVIHA